MVNEWGYGDFGCLGGLKDRICESETNEEGTLRYIFDPLKYMLNYDYNVDHVIVTRPPPITNPIIPCLNQNCPNCTNILSGKLLRATGNWAMDFGSQFNWNPEEPLGLMTYDENTCVYFLTLDKLKTYTEYEWKLTIDDSFNENYGNLIDYLY